MKTTGALLLSAPAVAFGLVPKMAASPQSVRKTIVITGANSGIGLDAAGKFVKRGHEVFVACRTEAKAQEAARATGAAGYFECDLSSLDSVKGFCKRWGSKPIDVLCLNAGMAPSTRNPTPRFTADGFEETIGVNHLGHFLLHEKLIGSVEKSKLKSPRVVVTASSVHDPDTPGGNIGPGAGVGDLQGFKDFSTGKRFEMADGSPYNGDKAYKDSKLLNVLFTRELSRRLAAKRSKVTVNCFSPGLIPSSGLFRSQNVVFRTIFNFAATNLLGVAASVSEGGNTLVYMAEAPELEGVSGKFYATPPGKPKADFGERTISKEASDEGKARLLWDLSTKVLRKAEQSKPMVAVGAGRK